MTVDWSWIGDHTHDLTSLALSHLQAALLAVLFGLLISLPLAVVAHRVRALRHQLPGGFVQADRRDPHQVGRLGRGLPRPGDRGASGEIHQMRRHHLGDEPAKARVVGEVRDVRDAPWRVGS